MYWESYSHKQIKDRVFNSLKENLDYREKAVLGLPASYLDTEVFYDDAPFLKDAPFLSALIANPNHIGCHTLNESEAAFEGTHKIEKELIDLCAQQIFGGGTEEFDGYVASGGTEANIQAIWILKRYFETEFRAKNGDRFGLFRRFSLLHAYKASKLLSIDAFVTSVEMDTRKVTKESIKTCYSSALEQGVKHL